MVGRSVRFVCEKCRREYFGYDEARSCEIQHVVDEAVAQVTESIKKIGTSGPFKAARRSASRSSVSTALDGGAMMPQLCGVPPHEP